ncbi:hypothetical protein [Armatimonas sp.]|uniref:hypothetical protein n=1 Tax=Armatimonas sp. TaxID=1872638 RepID=UPI0037508ECA
MVATPLMSVLIGYGGHVSPISGINQSITIDQDPDPNYIAASDAIEGEYIVILDDNKVVSNILTTARIAKKKNKGYGFCRVAGRMVPHRKPSVNQQHVPIHSHPREACDEKSNLN